MKNIYLIFITVLIAISTLCAQNVKKIQSPQINNNIKITTTGNVNIKSTTLYYYDSIGVKVPKNNTVNLNQAVRLLLVVKPNSWFQKDSIVSIGASEKIVTNAGVKVLEEKDLFASFTDINAVDAEYISLKAVITGMTKKIPYFKVSFTVWDKWGKGKIMGTYILKINQ